MVLPHFDVICDLLLNRRTATWNLFVSYDNKKTFFISKYFNITRKPAFLCPLWRRRIKAIWRDLLSIQNEAIWLVPVRSKELCLVEKNHATVNPYSSFAPRGMKTCSESRIKLRNLKVLKKMLEKSSQLLSSEQSCELKSLDVALNTAGVEKIPSENLWLQSTWPRPFYSSLYNNPSYSRIFDWFSPMIY